MNDHSPAVLDGGPVQPGSPPLTRLYNLLVLVAATVAVVVAIWLLGDVLMVVFAASLLAVILYGTSSLLSRVTGLPHWAALALVCLVILGLLVALGFYAGPGLGEEIGQLRETLRGQVTSLSGRLSQSSWGRFILGQLPTSLGGTKQATANTLPISLAGSVAGYLTSAVGLFGTLAVVLITAVYLAASPATYVNGALRLVPPRHRLKVGEALRAAGHALWFWSAGQAIDMVVVGVLSGVGLWVIGVPLALVLGVLAGLCNFVPYIGALAGAVPAVLIAFSVGWTQGIETVALYLVIQGFEGNVMAPLIQKRAVNLPPGLTILSQTTFGAILGLPGLIFATPLMAAILAVMNKVTPPLAPAEKIESARP